VPAGDVLGMPAGISFIGTAFSEPTLIKLAPGFEAVTHARFQPTFARDITKAHTAGRRGSVGLPLCGPKRAGRRYGAECDQSVLTL
jgi:hypothetical protein